MKKRIFVSATYNGHLDDRRKKLKAAIIKKISDAGYEPQEFWESGFPENLAWNFDNCDRTMRKCVGAVVFGFPRWVVAWPNSDIRLVGEFNHYESAVALTYGLPLLLLAEKRVEDREIV
jgi:hypothetical protein